MLVKLKYIDLLIGIVSVGIAMYVFIESADFPPPHASQLGAAVFPRILAIFILGLGLWVSASGWQKKEAILIHHLKEVVICLCMLILYGVTLKQLGFLVTTPIFIAATLYILRLRNIMNLVLLSLGTTGIIFLIFRLLLAVPLPHGLIRL